MPGAGEAIGATGWNATNLLGLSTQVSPAEALAVTHRRPEGLRSGGYEEQAERVLAARDPRTRARALRVLGARRREPSTRQRSRFVGPSSSPLSVLDSRRYGLIGRFSEGVIDILMPPARYGARGL